MHENRSTTAIEIELLTHAQPISGRVKTGNLNRDFIGWLDLLSAIEDSRRPTANTAPDQPTSAACTPPADTHVDTIVDRVLSALGELPGVAAVALGGSRARGQGLPDSDVDIAVYYSRADPPAIEELHRIATELHDPGAPKLLGGYGEWGPWINGGALITIAGRRTDLLLRELEQVEAVIRNCRRGIVESVYTPGHPHAFHTHIYAGEAHHNQPLYDRYGTLAALKNLTVPYPQPLREALVRRFGWEMSFSIPLADKAIKRGDHAYAAGIVFRCIACMVQVIFAVNERYFLNEKRSVAAATAMTRSPPNFDTRVTLCLPGGSQDPTAALTALRDDVAALIDEGQRDDVD
jgi:predicted nucleotidyltransferase